MREIASHIVGFDFVIAFDEEAVAAAFAQPETEGGFPPDFAAYLRELGAVRPSVFLMFAPKAAGTYLRSAAVEACGGQVTRVVHAQGGRDAVLYLPALLNYYAHGFPSRTLVTHVHMQALPSNVAMMEALNLRPVIMMRSIPDMLASYWDMLDDADEITANHWLNQQLPPQFKTLSDRDKGDYLIEMMAPWYVSYFATWIDYLQAAPERVLMLDYDGFRADPAASLQALLIHSRLPAPRENCEAALAQVWKERRLFRFNKGVAGRGRDRFSPLQLSRLSRMLAFYPQLEPVAARLIPPP
jgi:hypothetical protein